MGKRKKLRKRMRRRGLEGAPALVFCVGESCAPREVSRALAEQTRAYAQASGAPVRVERVGCLGICEKGPIVATFPDIEFHERVDFARACRLVDELARAVAEDVPKDR